MSLVRRFRGGLQRFTPPTGLVSAERVAQERADISTQAVVELPSGSPDQSWTLAQIDAYAELNEITLPTGAKKAEKLAAIAAEKMAALAPDDEGADESAGESAESLWPAADGGYPSYTDDTDKE